MALKPNKRPRDPIQLAKLIGDIAIGELEDNLSESKLHPSPKRKGGLLGGKARANTLSKDQRHVIAKNAAKARWDKSI